MNKLIIPLILILAIFACATPGAITGGEKDVIAPVLYESNPANQSLNFKDREIRLYFNEWMALDNLQKELIITPRTKVEFEQSLKKQELILTLKSDLKDSTTYTFNFRKGLKDVTEGNLWENPVLAFSTGSYLDSLVLQGTVKELHTQQAAKNYLVGIYDANSDTANLRQGEPLYFTTTDEKGNYRLQNIKPGKYLLYAFADQNNNLINEPASEGYGFYPELIDLKDSIPNIDLLTAKINEDTLKLKKTGPSGKDFIINYNKGIATYTITNAENTDQYIYASDEEKAQNIRIYKENFPDLSYSDSLRLFVTVNDSINNLRTDTVYAKFRESRITSDDIKITSMPESKILTGTQELLITTSKPVASIHPDSILLKYDSILLKQIEREQINLSENRKIITINLSISKKAIDSLAAKQKALQDSLKTKQNESTADSTKSSQVSSSKTVQTDAPLEQTSDNGELIGKPKNTTSPDGSNKQATIRGLHLYLGKGAFVGLEGDSTEVNSTIFSFKNPADFGIIKGSVINPPSNYIIQLLNSNYEVVDTLINKETFTFNYVKPGDYYLRAIIDENSNKKWDSGNPLSLKPAEDIIYLDEKLTVKPNWELIDKNIVFDEEKPVDNTAPK